MGNCKTCRFWGLGSEDLTSDINPITFEEFKSDAERMDFYKHEVQYCMNPNRFQKGRPERDGIKLYQGIDQPNDQIMATGEDFGCTSHEVEL